MSRLDGGSAAPPTAGVPAGDRATVLRTPARWLNDPEFAGIEILDYDGWRGADWQAPITVQEFRRRLWLCTITGPARRSPDHSGVAGEPEATTKEASEIAVAVSPTPTHAPTPETPGAASVAGGVTVPDEAVEKYWTTFADAGGQFHANGRAVTPAIRAGLTAAAPLIVARYLRDQADREHPTYEGVQYPTDYGTGVEYDTVCTECGCSWYEDDGGCLARQALLEEAAGLERGGNRG